MTFHGHDDMYALGSQRAPAFEMAAERRVTFAIVMDQTPGIADRLARVLAWRGYRFDRVVVQEGRHGAREGLQITLTADDAAADALKALIERYAPVHALRTLYTAPVMRAKPGPAAQIRSAVAAASAAVDAVC